MSDEGEAVTEWPFGLRLTCSAAPVQVEGPIDGGYVYFRARHGWWTLSVGRSWDEAVDRSIDGPRFEGEWESDAPDDYGYARALLNEYVPRLREVAS